MMATQDAAASQRFLRVEQDAVRQALTRACWAVLASSYVNLYRKNATTSNASDLRVWPKFLQVRTNPSDSSWTVALSVVRQVTYL